MGPKRRTEPPYPCNLLQVDYVRGCRREPRYPFTLDRPLAAICRAQPWFGVFVLQSSVQSAQVDVVAVRRGLARRWAEGINQGPRARAMSGVKGVELRSGARVAASCLALGSMASAARMTAWPQAGKAMRDGIVRLEPVLFLKLKSRVDR